MTRKDFIAKLEAEGFTARRSWCAKRNREDRNDNIHHYLIHAPGRYVGSMIINEFGDGGFETLYALPSNSVVADIAHLRQLAELAPA